MKRWSWRMREAAARLGWPGIAGLALLVYAITLAATGITAGHAQANQLDLELTEAQHAHDIQQRPESLSGADRLAAFYQRFPQPRTVPDALADIYEAAAHAGLVLERGTYKWSSNPGDRFIRYEIELPLKGPYPKIQLLAYQAMQKIPALALNDISFKREGTGAADVEAKLHFTLYMVGRDG